MDIHSYVIQFRSNLGSIGYIFMENDIFISLRNLFQNLLRAEILCE